MYFKLLLPILLFCFSAGSTAFGQAIADFDFDDPDDLENNAVPGGIDAISINPNARGANGGVFTVHDPNAVGHQNIDLEVPVNAVTNPNRGSIYIETDVRWNEESGWLFVGGELNHTGIFHHKDEGFSIRYYTTSDDPQNYINTDFIGFPLEEGVLKKVTFYYDEPTGLAYLYIDGEEVWKTTDSKDSNGNFYTPTPGEPFYWHTENQTVTVGANMNGSSHLNGQGSTPSLYRFRVYDEPCFNINSLDPPQVSEQDIDICTDEIATLEASGATDGAFYFWYENMDDPQAQPLRDSDGNTYNGSTIPVAGEELEAGQTYTFYVIISNGACDSPPQEVRVHVHQTEKPTASIESPPICGSGTASISLSSQEGNRFLWYTSLDPSEAHFTETGDSYTTDNLSQSTTYYVSVMGEYCESERTAVQVEVHPIPPQPAVEQASYSLCGPGEVEVELKNTSTTDYSYNWYSESNGDLVLLQSSTEPTFSLTASSDTRLLVKAFNGNCESTVPAEVNIEVNQLPYIDAGEDVVLLKGESVQLQATGRNGETVNCSWEPTESLDRSDIPNPEASPTISTAYVVTRTDPFSGCQNSDTIEVRVINKFPVPNAFSPNYDGLNDTWEIPNIENYPDCVIKVFNSWGNEIFHSRGYRIPWDGTFNGQELPSGSYYYTLQLSPQHEAVKGSVFIVR